MEDRETARMRKYGESKTTRIMIATVPHVTSGLGLRKFQADAFLLPRVYLGQKKDQLTKRVPRFSCASKSQGSTYGTDYINIYRVRLHIAVIANHEYQSPNNHCSWYDSQYH